MNCNSRYLKFSFVADSERSVTTVVEIESNVGDSHPHIGQRWQAILPPGKL
jgi:hypothetical protein